jgi:hypothetical protein
MLMLEAGIKMAATNGVSNPIAAKLSPAILYIMDTINEK